jgi:hypothetical protein
LPYLICAEFEVLRAEIMNIGLYNATCLHAGFFLVLFFNLEDGGGIFLPNVG